MIKNNFPLHTKQTFDYNKNKCSINEVLDLGNKDRGNIKWDAIMLPEHVEMLKEVFEEEEYKEKPILDEQQVMEINATLQNALENDLTVEIRYFSDHDKHIIEGKLLTVDLFDGYLSLDDEGMTRIAFDELLEVTL